MDLEAADGRGVWWKAGGLGFPTEATGGDFEIGAASPRLYQSRSADKSVRSCGASAGTCYSSYVLPKHIFEGLIL